MTKPRERDLHKDDEGWRKPRKTVVRRAALSTLQQAGLLPTPTRITTKDLRDAGLLPPKDEAIWQNFWKACDEKRNAKG